MGDPVCLSCVFCWALCTISGIEDTVSDIRKDLRVLVKEMRPPPSVQSMESVIVETSPSLAEEKIHVQ